MNVTLVPFGNAKYNGGVLTCQHGPNECTANSYEQCAIDEYPAFKVHYPYFTCLESAFLKGTEDIAATSAKCASAAEMDATKLDACVKDAPRAAALQRKYFALTPSDHKYTPWVVVGGNLSKSSGSKLTEEVCKAYKGPAPAACAAEVLAKAGRVPADVQPCAAP
mmetsp:Transcript_155/g.505  ORF Transcript_155/g.505 Transcript_155/m.505 type:complete len:165 (-) Transcript_155:334-828(-)